MCYKVYKEVWEMMDSPVYNLGVLTWYIDTVIKSKSCCGNKGRWRPLLWLGMDTLIVNRKSEIGKYSSHGERKLCKAAMCSCWKSFSYLKPAFTFQNDALGKQTDKQLLALRSLPLLLQPCLVPVLGGWWAAVSYASYAEITNSAESEEGKIREENPLIPAEGRANIRNSGAG